MKPNGKNHEYAEDSEKWSGYHDALALFEVDLRATRPRNSVSGDAARCPDIPFRRLCGSLPDSAHYHSLRNRQAAADDVQPGRLAIVHSCDDFRLTGLGVVLRRTCSETTRWAADPRLATGASPEMAHGAATAVLSQGADAVYLFNYFPVNFPQPVYQDAIRAMATNRTFSKTSTWGG
ncbi:MAG: hypothetical protein JXA69_02040 [Phycisphaerae bacterium]|nr:hypothetical protein [Phycisphaerae bacterium]